jgi:caffeoyl-CoA O-methyltransferase
MFHSIPAAIGQRMRQLEAQDRRDRTDGTPRSERLRQITPETGRFLALLACLVPKGDYIEIGTSAGYSTLWLALACRQMGRSITTFEILPEKAALARDTFRQAGVEDVVRLVEADALDALDRRRRLSFCFLDAEKEMYAGYYDAVIPCLVPGGLLVADNAIDHRPALEVMLARALDDQRVDALIVPVGKGELLCRKH